MEPLYAENPRKLARLRDLADYYKAHGDLDAAGDRNQAEEWYRKSLLLWDRWKEVGTSSAYDRQSRAAVARLCGRCQ